MSSQNLNALDTPTPGLWSVRSEADAATTPTTMLRQAARAADDRLNVGPFLIVPDRLGVGRPWLASGIHRLPDAKLMAAAPDLAGTLLGLLLAPELRTVDLDDRTRRVVTKGWALLGRVVPHFQL